MGLLKIFINTPETSQGKPQQAYRQQIYYLRRVWDEETYGLDRIVRLFLCFSQFFFPILLIREIFGHWGSVSRRLAVECYTVFKLIFPVIVLWQGWYHQGIVIFLIVYFLVETFIHLMHLVFLSDIHSVAVSYRRSLLLLALHYAEVVFDFAVFYAAFDILTRPADAISALYFSVVAMTTVGFGDICARTPQGQFVVIAQLVICVVFVVVFINYFSQKEK